MINFNNPNQDKTAPIFQNQPSLPTSLPTSATQNSISNTNQTTNDPFDKLLNKLTNTKKEKSNIDQNLENYRKQIEQLDLEQLKIERKRLVDQIVKYMNEGKTDLLEETQKKYKIAMQVSDSKVMDFSASAIASNQENKPLAQTNTQEDFLKKLQESEILPPDNSTPPTIPQQISISQKTSVVDTTDTTVSSANPNVQMLSIPTTSTPSTTFNSLGMINNLNNSNISSNSNINPSLINALNSMDPNQVKSLFSNPSGLFNSINSLFNSNLLMDALNPVHPYSPLMTSYGVYAPNLRRDPIMNAFLNGELYPLDMAEMGVMSVLNRELFKKNED